MKKHPVGKTINDLKVMEVPSIREAVRQIIAAIHRATGEAEVEIFEELDVEKSNWRRYLSETASFPEELLKSC